MYRQLQEVKKYLP